MLNMIRAATFLVHLWIQILLILKVFCISILSPAQNMSDSWVHSGGSFKHPLWSSLEQLPPAVCEAHPSQSTVDFAVQGGECCGSRNATSSLQISKSETAAILHLHLFTQKWCSCLWAQESWDDIMGNKQVFFFNLFLFYDTVPKTHGFCLTSLLMSLPAIPCARFHLYYYNSRVL